MRTWEVSCPAKVNTFLAVGPPDATGYHPIRTYFHAISMVDTLKVQEATTNSFECANAELPADNTVTKAWRLAREFTDIPPLAVTLFKTIPAQAGLGGGSSDAAGFLRALCDVTRGRLSEDEAHEVAFAVGADVPFFLTGGCARGEGYGEILSPLPDSGKRWLVVAMPEGTVVSTPDAYRALDAAARPFLEFPTDPWAVHNDFEAVAPEACRTAIEGLRQLGATVSGLTGSGAAAFGVFDGQESADAAAKHWSRQSHGRCSVCHTLTREESLWTS